MSQAMCYAQISLKWGMGRRRDTVGVNSGEIGILRGAVFDDEVPQAVTALGTSVVETMSLSEEYR